MFLEIGSRIGSATVRIQPAFIAYTYGVRIVPFRMCTGRFYRTKTFDIPVLPYIIMITCAGEAPAQVVCG